MRAVLLEQSSAVARRCHVTAPEQRVSLRTGRHISLLTQVITGRFSGHTPPFSLFEPKMAHVTVFIFRLIDDVAFVLVSGRNDVEFFEPTLKAEHSTLKLHRLSREKTSFSAFRPKKPRGILIQSVQTQCMQMLHDMWAPCVAFYALRT